MLLFLWLVVGVCVVCFFFKQKTAYELRISDWSSDVCSSDLRQSRRRVVNHSHGAAIAHPCFFDDDIGKADEQDDASQAGEPDLDALYGVLLDRKSVV